MITLTGEQTRILDESAESPPRVLDPRTQRTYFLVSADDYARTQAVRKEDRESVGIESRNGDNAHDGDWADALNERRIELIDKEIQGGIATAERAELAELQRRTIAYRDRVAPLPINGAIQLHQRLLEIERKNKGS